MNTGLNVLIIEDVEDDAVLLVRELKRGGYDVLYERVETASELSIALDNLKWEVIFSDYSMPGFDALAALKIVQARGIDIPFIIVSGTMGEDTAAAVLKAGAHDFIVKDKLARLIPAMERELREAAERRQRHWMEKELRQSEDRFVKTFHASPIAISISSQTRDIFLDVNEQFLDFVGYTRKEVIGYSSMELGIWANLQDRTAVAEALSQYGTVRNLEVKFRTKSGKLRDGLASFATIDLDGEPCVLSMFNDITERKQAENELKALYNATSYLFKSDSLLNLGHQIVEAIVHEFRKVDCGLILVDRLKDTLMPLARRGDYDVDIDRPIALDGPGLVMEAIRTGKIVYAPDVNTHDHYVTNDPRTRSELVIPLRTAKGILGVLDLQNTEPNAFKQSDQRILGAFSERAAAAIEIMQLYEEINQRAAELEQRVLDRTTELEWAKSRVETILYHSSDAIILAGSDGGIEQTNPGFNNLFSYEPDEAFGLSLTALVGDDYVEKLRQALEEVVQTSERKRIEVICRRKNGTVLAAGLSLAPLPVRNQAYPSVICSVRDITEHKRMEEGLRNALEKEKELNELKSRFVSMVSHDIRTPLTVILSSTEILQSYYDRLDIVKRSWHFDKIRTQVGRMIALLKDVLTISQADAGATPFNPMPVSLHRFCQDIAEEFQSEPNLKHTLIYSYVDGPTRVLVDERLLQQAVINLLTNAFKYSPEGSTVNFDLSFDKKNAFIRIQDSGISISEADLPRLFDPFHRAGNVGSIEGTGLGLAIVKRSIDAHGGKITVESRLGIGTTFMITLPLDRTSEAYI